MKYTVFSKLNCFDHEIKQKEEMLKLGKLDFMVEKKPLHIHYDSPLNHPDLGDRLNIVGTREVAVVRTDKRDWLGTVGANFGIVQNDEVADICDVWIQNGEASYVAAGAPNLGERIYIILKTNGVLNLGSTDQDNIENYFFLSSAFDGSEAIVGYPSPIHLRSNSILVFPDHKHGAIKIKHSRYAVRRVSAAKKILTHVMTFWQRFVNTFEMIKDISMTDEMVKGYFEAVVEDNPTAESNTRAENIRAEILDLYKKGPSSQMPYAQNTLFGAYLACTTYADHHKTVRKSNKRDEVGAQIHAKLIGDGARMKAEALGFAVKMAEQFAKVNPNV